MTERRWVPGPDSFDDEFTEADWHEAHIVGGYLDPNCSVCRAVERSRPPRGKHRR